MDFEVIFRDSSAGILVTDADFRIVWVNRFEEDFYKKPLLNLNVIGCHQERNREKVQEFLKKFSTGAMKEYTKLGGHGMNTVIHYSSYYKEGNFAGIVRTRIRLPKKDG